MTNKAGPDEPIVIKKYANRRLYNTATSSYVTLDTLCEMVKNNDVFVVRDARTSEDITRSVLTQIIVEQEAKGQNLLPINFLRQLIGYYGHNLGSLLPQYLEASMETFSHNQEELNRQLAKAFDGVMPADKVSEMGRQNVAMFEKAMSLFNPFAGGAAAPAQGEDTGNGRNGPPPSRNDEVADLKRELDEVRRRLDDLAAEKN